MSLLTNKEFKFIVKSKLMNNIENLIDIYDGNAWQRLANSLLILKYTVQQFQKIPDEHRGDWGIEGYTLNGEVFQCYSPDRPYEADHLYKLQRSKVTDDITKFKSNKNELLKLLPRGAKFCRWHFLTTVHLSKNLVAHCAKKTKEVIDSCDHVTTDFTVMVHLADDFFLNEIPKFSKLGLAKMQLKIPSFSEEAINTFSASSPSIQTIREKLEKGKAPAGAIDELSKDYIKDYMIWQSLLEALKSTTPEIFEVFVKNITSLEIDVKRKYQLNQRLNVTELDAELLRLKQVIESQLTSTLDTATLDYLARGVVADWMVRCPISF